MIRGSPPSKRRFRTALPAAFLTGVLWGAAAAVLEALLFNRLFHTGLQQPLATFDLAFNYATYAGVGALLLRLALAGVKSARFDRGRLTEALAGVGLFVAVLLNYIRISGAVPFPLSSPTGLGTVAAAAFVVLALVVYKLQPIQRRVLRGALAAWIVAGVLWVPLFGRYTGLLNSSGDKAPPGSYKNVVFLLIDTLRRDFLDCCGADWAASPAADRLAAGGTIFDRHMAQSSWTLPSTATMLTGRFPSSHGAVAVARPVSPDAVMLAEVFQQARFRTGAFVENLHVLPSNGFGRGFDRFWAYWLPWVYDGTFLCRYAARLRLPLFEFAEKEDFPLPVTRPDQVNWDAKTTTDRALSWLRGLDGSPFFIYLHYMGPHGPYGPPEFLLDRPRPAAAVIDHPRRRGGGYPLGDCGEAVNAQVEHDMRTLYAADILYVDRQIERLLEWLEETGRLDETLIVYTSDHGEEFYEHCCWNHGHSAFEEALRVPLILHEPGAVPAGLRIEALTRHVDLMPTVLDLAGLVCPDKVHGRSLRPLLAGEALDPVPVYSEIYPSHPAGCSVFSLIQGNHKLISVKLGGDSALLLYDLAADSLEIKNLAESFPGLRDELVDEMLDWDLVAHRYSSGADTVRLDERSLKRLKSLGYVQ